MNIVERALTTYTESKAMEAETAGDYAEQARQEFLQAARDSASRILDAAAADLDWQYTPPSDLPDRVEEARALLTPDGLAYLRYRADYDKEAFSFDLVQPRRADRISPVTGLFNLGQLLTEDQPNPSSTGDADSQSQEPGPLAAAEEAEQRAARVAALVRRLLAEHPDAGLVVDAVCLSSYQSGDGASELHLTASSLDAVRGIAAAVGTTVTVRVSSSPGVVLEHGTATSTVDGVAVRLRAYDRMPDDQAAAWLAQQNQPTDEACDGGDA